MRKIIIILLFFLVSCRSKQTYTKQSRIVDTLVKVEFQSISKPINSIVDFRLKCDSLGNIPDINYKTKSGKNKANISIKNNRLNVGVETAESKVKIDTIYKTKFIEKKQEKEDIRYRTPFWHWIAHILAVIIIFVAIKYF